MKTAAVAFTLALLFCYEVAHACSIQNEKRVQIGVHRGIEGVCSNNGLPITCEFEEGAWITCDGPSGSYTGEDLQSLVYSACGCTEEGYQKKKENEEMQEYKK